MLIRFRSTLLLRYSLHYLMIYEPCNIAISRMTLSWLKSTAYLWIQTFTRTCYNQCHYLYRIHWPHTVYFRILQTYHDDWSLYSQLTSQVEPLRRQNLHPPLGLPSVRFARGNIYLSPIIIWSRGLCMQRLLSVVGIVVGSWTRSLGCAGLVTVLYIDLRLMKS